MANEHIRTAASNLQRAAQDVRQQIQATKNDITRAQQQALTSIKTIKTEIDQLQRSKNSPTTDLSAKVAVDMQVRNLQFQIAQIQKDTNEYVHRMEAQINGLNNEINEFESLSGHLNAIA